MEKIGFIDIEVHKFKWPINWWPKGEKHKTLGLWNYHNFAPNVEGFSLAPLTRALGWQKEEVQVLAARVKNDMKNTSIHAYWPG